MLIITIKGKWLLVIAVLLAVTIGWQYSRRETVSTLGEPKGYIAIIIDDFGNHGEGTDMLLEMGIPMTAAVMPFLPHTVSDAQAAAKAGWEVIMHIPMEPEQGKKEWLGPKGITCDLAEEEIEARIREGLEEIGLAVGMNNHMGSKATQDKRVVETILKVAKEEKLFFVDSKTNPHSVVLTLGQELGVYSIDRDVFLDNSKDQREIEKQVRKLGEIALTRGYAVGIGHVGPEGGSVTARGIKAVHSELEAKGIRFVPVSQLQGVIQGKEKKQ